MRISDLRAPGDRNIPSFARLLLVDGKEILLLSSYTSLTPYVRLYILHVRFKIHLILQYRDSRSHSCGIRVLVLMNALHLTLSTLSVCVVSQSFVLPDKF